MMKPKDALKKDGKVPVKEGRGRLSKEGDKRCRELAAMGWDILGYPRTGPAVSSPTAPNQPTVTKVKNQAGVKEVLNFVILHEEGEHRAVGTDKREWSMREVCNNCRVSLVQCHCHDSTILGGIKVNIVRRT